MPAKTTATPASIETARKAAAPALFGTVRSSKDLSLVAFGAALLTAFALQAGAFLPRFGAPPPASPPAVEPGREPAAPAFVASRRASSPAPAAEAAQAPCEVPAAARL
jgi:hypothetical protein